MRPIAKGWTVSTVPPSLLWMLVYALKSNIGTMPTHTHRQRNRFICLQRTMRFSHLTWEMSGLVQAQQLYRSGQVMQVAVLGLGQALVLVRHNVHAARGIVPLISAPQRVQRRSFPSILWARAGHYSPSGMPVARPEDHFGGAQGNK